MGSDVAHEGVRVCGVCVGDVRSDPAHKGVCEGVYLRVCTCV